MQIKNKKQKVYNYVDGLFAISFEANKSDDSDDNGQ